jgi:hypothetical protein
MSLSRASIGTDLINGGSLVYTPIRDLDQESLRKVALLVAGQSRDAEECKRFLDHLGLLNGNGAHIEEDLFASDSSADSTSGRDGVRGTAS